MEKRNSGKENEKNEKKNKPQHPKAELLQRGSFNTRHSYNGKI